MDTKFKPTVGGFIEFIETHSAQVARVADYLDAGNELSEEDYEYFFEYYLNSGEMPYGTAKARDGDPYIWVSERVVKDAK